MQSPLRQKLSSMLSPSNSEVFNSCDRLSPCSNCRRANLACVFPSTDRPPRWARRQEHLRDHGPALNAPAVQGTDESVGKLMDRLRNLENLVKELRGQQEEARVAQEQAPAQDRDAEHQADTSLDSNTSTVQKHFGRLVLQDASRSRYVSSGFWSQINDEVGLCSRRQFLQHGSLTFAAAHWAKDGHSRSGR